MEPNQIKDADILDILFDGRNKDYGAYELRKTYNRRITKAMLGTGTVIGLLLIGYYVSGMGHSKIHAPVLPDDPTIVLIKKDADRIVVPPKPRVVTPPAVAQVRMTTLRVVPDNQVKPDEKPPENDQADNVKISTQTVAGTPDDVVAGPPVQGAVGGVVEAPKKTDGDDGLFIKVEIDASFPGGLSAWKRFIERNLHYPDEAVGDGISGTVMVQFIVDKEGNVSDVHAISGPDKGGLREEAERVIKKSGKWTPAQQNGRYVKAYRSQPVIFQIGTE